MALGGIATAAVVIGVIELAPWKGTKAAPQPQAEPAAVEMPAPTPAQTSPAQPATEPGVQPMSPRVAGSARPAPNAARSSPEPVTSPPPMEPQQPPAQPAAAAAPQPSAPAADSAEIEKVRDDYDMLQVRATTILNHSLWRSQADRGMSIRSDAANARSLMETYLGNAVNAMNAGNAASAKSYMEKAERQIEILEKILN
jgi:outer membrane biosynthesis protein TonB